MYGYGWRPADYEYLQLTLLCPRIHDGVGPVNYSLPIARLRKFRPRDVVCHSVSDAYLYRIRSLVSHSPNGM